MFHVPDVQALVYGGAHYQQSPAATIGEREGHCDLCLAGLGIGSRFQVSRNCVVKLRSEKSSDLLFPSIPATPFIQICYDVRSGPLALERTIVDHCGGSARRCTNANILVTMGYY